jgi:hypothetical protein
VDVAEDLADALTIIARVVLAIGMVGLGIGIVGVAIAIFGWFPEDWLTHVTTESGRTFNPRELWVALPPMIAAMVVFALSFDFASKLGQMIDTVGANEVFTLANAGRLTHMAWLTVGIEIASLLTSGLGAWGERRLGEGGLEFSGDFSFSGIALALVLFILARVFREGARMRAELEGTV